MRLAAELLCLTTLLLAGCSSMGPPTIARDRFDYVTAISDSWKRQTLLNLLETRYTDAPVFMDIASVINSYSWEGELTLTGQGAPVGRGDAFVSLGAVGRYADRPTITYSPLTGDKFAKHMMTPLPVTGILLLLQGGYPADLVMRICVNTINGLENSYGGPGNPRPGSPQFRDLLLAMREAQIAGGMGMQIKEVDKKQATVMFLRPLEDETAAEANRRIAGLLGLNAQSREFTVIYGSSPASDTEIAILSRSMLQVMVDFASYIDVSPEEVAEGRVYAPQRSAEQERMFPPLLVVRYGSAQPQDAFVAVRYRDQWFWIDDRDKRSKSIFNFLMLMFSLTETGEKEAGPVVTVPVR